MEIFCIRLDFKKAYDSVRGEVLNNILIEYGVPMKLVRRIKICSNEMYSKVRIGKHLFDSFPIENEELHNLYSSPSIIRMIKSRRMRWAGHVARMGRKGMHIRYWWESQKVRDHWDDQDVVGG
jgi:hypothetical protein